jgi:hypothetical protein
MDLADHRSRMLADTAPDGGETMIKAMLRLLRVELFLLMDEAEQLDQGDIMRLGRMVTQLARITMAFQQWTDKLKLLRKEPKPDATKPPAKGEGGVSDDASYAIMRVQPHTEGPSPHLAAHSGGAATTIPEHPACFASAREPGQPNRPI